MAGSLAEAAPPRHPIPPQLARNAQAARPPDRLTSAGGSCHLSMTMRSMAEGRKVLKNISLNDLDAVLRGIIDQAQTRLPLHHPAKPDGPPPRDTLGEDFQ